VQRQEGPLSGVKVLEIGHYIAAPHCAMMLADQGAEVIKLEPRGGEPGRKAPPYSEAGESLAFACHNRGKRSVELDLRRPESAEALNALLRWADIVVTNYAHGIPEKLGFGFEQLSQINPRACMVHITGFGQGDERRDYLAFDPAIQAMSGFSDLTGDADGPPTISQFFVADHAAGMVGAYAAMCALWEARASGKGRLAPVSMLEAMTSQLSYHVPSKGVAGKAPTRVARSPESFDYFQTSDAPMYLAAGTPASWQAFSDLLGHPEWAPEGKRPNLVENAELKATITALAGEWFAARTSAEAFHELQRRGVPCGVVRSVAQIYDEELAAGSSVISHVELGGGGPPVPVPGPAFAMSGAPNRTLRVASLGENTSEILAELGLAAERIAELAGASGTSKSPRAA
jgi:crotonobetainyl-CoA:carnitine CoA-transferase CaiB-like acyl-CoA transferase